MIFLEKPNDFDSAHHIVICVLENSKGEILLLKRLPQKFKGGMWDIPGGKLEKTESYSEAMRREILKETRVQISERELQYCGAVFVRYPEFDFISELFYCKMKDDITVQINKKEHSAFGWFKLDTARKMKLVPDEIERIDQIYGIIEKWKSLK